MARVQFASLFQADNGSVLGSFTFANAAMAEALKKAQDAKTQRVAENAATLFTSLDAHNVSLLGELRRIRKLEKAAKEKLEGFTGAVQHFLDTGNFGPLYPYMPNEVARICNTLGVDLPTPDEQKVSTK